MPFKTINSKSLFYTDTQTQTQTQSTPASRITTLLLHGLGSSSSFYSTITPALAPQTRCIALDTPGSGLSQLDPSPSREQSIASIADDAIALLDALAVEGDVVVVGHSMGGIVASTVAARCRGRVRAVVLLGPVQPAEGMAAVFGKRVEVVKAGGLEPLADTIPTGATGRRSTPLQHAFIRALILGTSPAGYVSLCKAIATATQPDYASIDVPLLILAGEDDKTASLEGSEGIAAAYGTEGGRKSVVVLEGVGHWYCVEAGEEVGRRIGDFVRGL